jgi:hypothetical protein
VYNNESHYEETVKKEQEEAKELELKLKDHPSNLYRKGSDNSVASFKMYHDHNTV